MSKLQIVGHSVAVVSNLDGSDSRTYVTLTRGERCVSCNGVHNRVKRRYRPTASSVRRLKSHYSF